ncbi:MAG: SHOCT domain-containing protein [bacterium]
MFTSLFLLAAPFLQMWDGDHMGGDGAWGGWLLMSLMMLLFFGTIAVVGISVLRSSHVHSSPGSGPLDIARERYARGEITDEDLERIKLGLK